MNIVHEDMNASGDLDSIQIKVEYCEGPRLESPVQRESSESDDSFKIHL